MRFDRVRLSNFKPYADADLELSDGVTVIHGLNGSGKSSLLEACFFALYGANALDETLDDVVTTGAEEAEIELWFTHSGGAYRVGRRLRATGERTTTAECVLDGPDVTVEGARDVEAFVTDLLRMDAEAFVNCAYVRQGEVNKLINATPAQRQDMLDDLLQLGKLEEYRERAGRARLGVEDVLTSKRGQLEALEAQIAAKEEADLHERLNGLRTELNRVDDDIERFEENRERARKTRDDATAILEAEAEKREQLADLRAEIDGLRETIEETERERNARLESIGERRERVTELTERADDLLANVAVADADEEAVRERLAEVDDRLTELREAVSDHRLRVQSLETQAERLAEKADDLDERSREKREAAADREARAKEHSAALAERRTLLDELAGKIERTRETFADAPVDFGAAAGHREEIEERLAALRERQQETAVEVNSLASRVEAAEELLAEGKCPECGQPVEGSPHVDGLDEDRERLADLREQLARRQGERDALEADLERATALVDAEATVERLEERRADLQKLLDENDARIDALGEEAEALREEAEELATEAAEKREAAETQRGRAAECREELDEANEAVETAKARRERLSALCDVLTARRDERESIERLREQREQLAELNDERRERLAEKRESRAKLEDAVDESAVESAEKRLGKAKTYLEQVAEKLDELGESRDELQSAIGGVRNEIEELESLREQRRELAARVESLESLHEETVSLESLYGDLRADLRRRNVEILERMLNETFDLVYGNDAYSHIRLDGEYDLTVFQKDGTALAPEQLSGGERALFNLSLRCAIYRLLAEGIDGTAPLPPLILDEPTVFLDAGHVSRLVDLVAEMRSLGVRQIIIVSHDDELVGAADDLVRVEKDPTTNRSTVETDDEAVAVLGSLSED